MGAAAALEDPGGLLPQGEEGGQDHPGVPQGQAGGQRGRDQPFGAPGGLRRWRRGLLQRHLDEPAPAGGVANEPQQLQGMQGAAFAEVLKGDAGATKWLIQLNRVVFDNGAFPPATAL